MTKSKTKPLAIMMAMLLVSFYTKAQESINASGGDASGNGGTAAYSIGQVVYTTNTGNSGSVAQGVQQAYEIFPVGNIETAMNISLTAFPNPIKDNLTLQINEFKNDKFAYQFYDMKGKLIISEPITKQQTFIPTESLPSAAYFIHVINQENKKIQTFKIIKN